MKPESPNEEPPKQGLINEMMNEIDKNGEISLKAFDTSLNYGLMGFSCSNCKDILIDAISMKAFECYKFPKLDTFIIISPKTNRW